MTKLNRFLLLMLLVPGFFLAGHFSAWETVSANVQDGEEGRTAIHISERVKIVRPGASPDASPAEPVAPPVASTEPDAETEDSAAGAAEASDDADVAAEEEIVFLPDDDALGEVMFAIAPEDRYYDETGRVDPFAPFLRRPEPEAAEVEEEEAIRRVPRTPLERIALGQLKLTAVIMADAREMVLAMVEDSRGKGYVIREGTYIGEDGGRVSRILPNKVLVEEPHRDVFGKTTIRERELQLQRQAGE